MKKLLLSITTSFIPLVAVTSVVSCSPSVEELFFRNKEVMTDVTRLLKEIDLTSKDLNTFKNDIEDILNDYVEQKAISEIRDFYVEDLYWTYSDNSRGRINQESFAKVEDFSKTNYVVRVDFEEKDGLDWESETEEFSVYNQAINYSEHQLYFDEVVSAMHRKRYEYETNESLFELKQEIIEDFSEQLAWKFKSDNQIAPHQLMSGELIADFHINVDIEGITDVKDIDTSERYDVKLTSGEAVDLGTEGLTLSQIRFRKDN